MIHGSTQQPSSGDQSLQMLQGTSCGTTSAGATVDPTATEPEPTVGVVPSKPQHGTTPALEETRVK